MTEKTNGCDNCKMLVGKRCKLWEVKVLNPTDSTCEAWWVNEQA